MRNANDTRACPHAMKPDVASVRTSATQDTKPASHRDSLNTRRRSQCFQTSHYSWRNYRSINTHHRKHSTSRYCEPAVVSSTGHSLWLERLDDQSTADDSAAVFCGHGATIIDPRPIYIYIYTYIYIYIECAGVHWSPMAR